jgi:site-specific DNA-methyltransferase (adenine-specific)
MQYRGNGALPIDKIICGDSYELIHTIPDNSVNLVITSPPYYQQRDYGGGIGNEEDVEAYIGKLVQIMRECVRVIRSDGNIIFNLGDKYDNGSLQLIPYRFAIATTKLDLVKLVNEITWVKKNPTPRQYKRRLVSSTEPFFHFVKSDHYFYNLDAYQKSHTSKKKKDRSNSTVGQRYFKLIEESDLTDQQKQHARQELLKVIQEVKSGKIEGLRMKIRDIHSEPFGGQAGGRQIQLEKNGFTIIRLHGDRIKRDVIDVAVESIKAIKHPAIYPVDLIIELLYLLSREGDIVLDPFMGSGSTAIACHQTGRRYIGFDLNPDYCKFAENRIKFLSPYTPLLF